MSKPVHEWSVDELRDWLAVKATWEKRGDRWYHPIYHRMGSGQKRHPITPGLASLTLPEGWKWSRGTFGWRAARSEEIPHTDRIEIPDTGDEWRDRAALKVAVMMAVQP